MPWYCGVLFGVAAFFLVALYAPPARTTADADADLLAALIWAVALGTGLALL